MDIRATGDWPVHARHAPDPAKPGDTCG